MKKFHNLSEKDKKAIQLASEILRKKFPVENVILFGSKARGDDDEESDIDLLLLTDRPISWEERKSVIDTLFDIELTYDVVISPLISTYYDWNEGMFSVMPIHNEIAREGIPM
ncbi:MAG: nucleotidyltransferase domain-containing protein [Desulfobacterales bacterium]